MFAQKRLELVDDGYECYEVYERQTALQNQPREAIAVASAKQYLGCIHNIVWSDSGIQTGPATRDSIAIGGPAYATRPSLKRATR